jgi:Rod binding domain-containing protein
MTIEGTAIPPSSASRNTGASAPTTEKLRGAAREFEALLISQILKSATPSESGLSGPGEDQAGDHAMQYAMEELGRAIAVSGGFGLSKLVIAGCQVEPVRK